MLVIKNYLTGWKADDAESKKDFKHKIGIVKKESRESKHFIRMITVAVPELKNEAKPLWQEAKELNLIFNTIYKKVSWNLTHWNLGID